MHQSFEQQQLSAENFAQNTRWFAEEGDLVYEPFNRDHSPDYHMSFYSSYPKIIAI